MPCSPGENDSSQIAQARHPAWAFWLVLGLAVAIRVPGMGRPLLGDFATKNVVYAMVARNWALGRTTLGRPMVDCLGQGGRMLHLVDLPVAAYAAGGLWKTLGGSLDVWGRLTSVLLSVASVAMIHALVRRRHGPHAALGAATVLAISPVAIVFGQAFMLESSVVFFALVALDGLDRWRRGGAAGWLLAAGLGLALLLLTKIYMLVLLLPLGAMLLGRDATSRSVRARAGAAAILLLAALPAAAWYARAYRMASPDGPWAGRVYYSVRQSTSAHPMPHPLLTSSDFYREMLDDLTSVVLGPVGFLLLWFGLLERSWRAWGPWLASMAMLMLLLPRKFYEMDYYWLVVLPPLAVLAGVGWGVICDRVRPGRGAVALLLAVAVLVSLRYAAGPSWTTPAEDRAVLAAAEATRRRAREGQPVVTVHGSGLDLLYYCDRPGWALDADDAKLAARLADCRRHGAEWLVVVGPPLADRRPTVQGDGFALYRLD